jgi:hypothetical protein
MLPVCVYWLKLIYNFTCCVQYDKSWYSYTYTHTYTYTQPTHTYTHTYTYTYTYICMYIYIHQQCAFIHGNLNKHRRHGETSLKTEMNFYNKCLLAAHWPLRYTLCRRFFFKFFSHFDICIPLLRICGITRQYYVFLCWIPPWRWPKNDEIFKRITMFVYHYI